MAVVVYRGGLAYEGRIRYPRASSQEKPICQKAETADHDQSQFRYRCLLQDAGGTERYPLSTADQPVSDGLCGKQAAVIHESMRKEVALKLCEEKEMVPMLDKLIEELLKLNK